MEIAPVLNAGLVQIRRTPGSSVLIGMNVEGCVGQVLGVDKIPFLILCAIL